MTEVGVFLIKLQRVENNKTNISHEWAANFTYRHMIDLKKHWPGGTFPIAAPKCGFRGEKCMNDPVENTKSKRFNCMV